MMRIEPFAFAGLPSRVLFGSGTLAQSGAEITRLGRKRALVLSTPNQKADAEALASRLGDVAVGVFAEATMHTPSEVTEQALAAFQTSGADCLCDGMFNWLSRPSPMRTDFKYLDGLPVDAECKINVFTKTRRWSMPFNEFGD
jgi:hypothetical protein